MAPQKHQKDKLVDVGLEGFALLDEFFERPKKSGGRLPTAHQGYDHQYQLHRQYLQYNCYDQYRGPYRGPQVVNIREPVIDSNQAALIYGGRGIVDYSIRKPIRRA